MDENQVRETIYEIVVNSEALQGGNVIEYDTKLSEIGLDSVGMIDIIVQIEEEYLMNELIDWFGKDFYIYKKNEGGQLHVSLKCNEQAFFYWALQYGPYVEVQEPISLRNRIAEAISKMNDKYNEGT